MRINYKNLCCNLGVYYLETEGVKGPEFVGQ